LKDVEKREGWERNKKQMVSCGFCPVSGLSYIILCLPGSSVLPQMVQTFLGLDEIPLYVQTIFSYPFLYLSCSFVLAIVNISVGNLVGGRKYLQIILCDKE
jgi:hypothetical protein